MPDVHKLDNESYYDTFSEWYERERSRGYHKLIDDLEVELIAPACTGRDVLEVGCGTGAILHRVAPLSRSAVGIDISRGMLEQAQERGLCCVHGSATDLPFADATFDVAYSFKVLAHIEDIERAMREVSRGRRPGGRAFLEFYKRHSLRFVAKRLAGPGAVASDKTHEGNVFVRWDAPNTCLSYLPSELAVRATHGVRVFTPAAFAHKIPGVAWALRRAEWFARDRRPFRGFGGFYVLEVEKTA